MATTLTSTQSFLIIQFRFAVGDIGPRHQRMQRVSSRRGIGDQRMRSRTSKWSSRHGANCLRKMRVLEDKGERKPRQAIRTTSIDAHSVKLTSSYFSTLFPVSCGSAFSSIQAMTMVSHAWRHIWYDVYI